MIGASLWPPPPPLSKPSTEVFSCSPTPSLLSRTSLQHQGEMAGCLLVLLAFSHLNWEARLLRVHTYETPFSVLEIEPGALCLLGKLSTTDHIYSPLFHFFISCMCMSMYVHTNMEVWVRVHA